MNKHSNLYIIVYASILVVVVATVLSIISTSLKPVQNKNIELEKKQNILHSINIKSNRKDVEQLYNKYIKASYTVDIKGKRVDGDAFNIDLRKEKLKPFNKQRLPVYESRLENGSEKIIIPLSGKGLWGPIWGYISFNDDNNTVYGVTFSHESETPGLGAQIATPNFQKQFIGKKIFDSYDEFVSIELIKSKNKDNNIHQVDAITGGTITSKGLEKMLRNCISSYEKFLKEK
ncbi:MAG: NADH:ubiquinone reductase (Na(+)-transporting) subunit C [Bacteroidetes bacterium]|nr:MAG: NADH:ubiquinone reductase (Na(+)-transporting) subunit C [Bacteroidota bacterium]